MGFQYHNIITKIIPYKFVLLIIQVLLATQLIISKVRLCPIILTRKNIFTLESSQHTVLTQLNTKLKICKSIFCPHLQPIYRDHESLHLFFSSGNITYDHQCDHLLHQGSAHSDPASFRRSALLDVGNVRKLGCLEVLVDLGVFRPVPFLNRC